MYIFYGKQMLQAANNDLFNPLVPEAHNSESKFSIKIRIIPHYHLLLDLEVYTE